MTDIRALTQRFDAMRDSGVCSPTTRALLDDAQAALAAQQAKINEARNLDLRHDIPPHRAWPAYQDAVRRILSDEQETPNE